MAPGGKLTAEVSARPAASSRSPPWDEGILQLVAQKTPDPFAFFYAKRQLQVETFDTFSLLLPEVPPVMGKALAGGGDSLEDLSNFVRSQSPALRTVAFWSGPVTVGPRARPGSPSTSRNSRARSGSWPPACPAAGFAAAEAKRSSKARWLCSCRPSRASWPFGDAADIPVTVRNDTGKPGTFTVSLTAAGPARVAEPTRSPTIAAGAAATVSFPVTAGEAEGVAELSVAVSGNGEASADTARLPVRSPLPPRTTVRSGALETASLTVPELVSGEFVPGTAKLDVTVGRFPLTASPATSRPFWPIPTAAWSRPSRGPFRCSISRPGPGPRPGAFEGQTPQAMAQSAIRA